MPQLWRFVKVNHGPSKQNIEMFNKAGWWITHDGRIGRMKKKKTAKTKDRLDG